MALLDEEVAALTVSVNELLAAVNVKKAQLDAAVTAVVDSGVLADAQAAEASRQAAALSELATAADAVQTAADRVQTGLDAGATAGDRAQTVLDAAATGADLAQTTLDAAATAGDRVQTGLDKAATAGDRVQTGLDRTQTGLDVLAAADAARLTAGTVTTGAPGSAVAVTISGAAGAQTVDVTIPRGDKGDTGDTGVSISSVVRTAGTGAAGTADTYTITFSDATTSTFNVWNGTDGTGAGDMTKTVYDTNNDGKVDAADSADAVPWIGVTGKPATFPAETHNHDTAYEPANANIQAHVGSIANPHAVTKNQLGLGSVDNTADSVKPVSTLQQTALDGKENAGVAATAVTTHTTTHDHSQLHAHSNSADLALITSDAGLPVWNGAAWPGQNSTASVIATTHTATAKALIFADTTTASWVLTLPPTPAVDDYVDICDYAGTFSTNPLILDGNGANLMGSTEQISLDSSNFTGRFRYLDATQGWRMSA